MATSRPSSTSAAGGAAANLSSLTGGWAPNMQAGQPRHPHKLLLSGKAIEELFVVLVVMAVLGIVASMVGRMCGGRHLGGDSPFDFEGWVEKQCAVCIDGEVDDPPAAPIHEGELPALAPLPEPGADPGAPLESCVEPPPPPDAPPPPPETAPEGAASGMTILQAPPPVAQPYHHYYCHHPVPIYRCQSCCREGLHHPHSSY